MKAHAQKPELVFLRNGRVHLNRRGVSSVDYWQWRSADQPARLLATHSIRIFPLHFPSHASPCAVSFRFSSHTCGVFVRSTPRRGSCTPGKDPVPIAYEAGGAPEPVWTCAENHAPTEIRSPDSPVRSEPLYRLSYPGRFQT